jgi:hypothetical protein
VSERRVSIIPAVALIKKKLAGQEQDEDVNSFISGQQDLQTET